MAFASIYLCYFRSLLSFLISTPSVWSIVLNFCHSQSRNLSLPPALPPFLPPSHFIFSISPFSIKAFHIVLLFPHISSYFLFHTPESLYFIIYFLTWIISTRLIILMDLVQWTRFRCCPYRLRQSTDIVRFHLSASTPLSREFIYFLIIFPIIYFNTHLNLQIEIGFTYKLIEADLF